MLSTLTILLAFADMEELRQFAEFNGADEAGELNHWDINFWGERLRESSYDINEVKFGCFLLEFL